MWDRLSESALKAVALAGEEADLLGQPYLGDEHLLVGLARGREAVAAGLLVQAGLLLSDARAELRALQCRGLTPPPSPDVARVLRSLGIDVETVQHNLNTIFGGDAVAAMELPRRCCCSCAVRASMPTRCVNGCRSGCDRVRTPGTDKAAGTGLGAV
jgi:hypothetical protein